jgi:DNA-binding transcriptional MerR regulator
MNELANSELGGNNPVAELDKQKPQKSASAFRTISEVSEDMGIPQHVLRFWETKFNQVRPMKRGGGRRYYRPEDVALLKHIHFLLYTEGYTIKGVQKLLKGQGKQQIVTAQVAAQAQPVMEPKVVVPVQVPVAVKTPLSSTQRTLLEIMLEDLKSLRDLVSQAQAA